MTLPGGRGGRLVCVKGAQVAALFQTGIRRALSPMRGGDDLAIVGRTDALFEVQPAASRHSAVVSFANSLRR